MVLCDFLVDKRCQQMVRDVTGATALLNVFHLAANAKEENIAQELEIASRVNSMFQVLNQHQPQRYPWDLFRLVRLRPTKDFLAAFLDRPKKQINSTWPQYGSWIQFDDLFWDGTAIEQAQYLETLFEAGCDPTGTTASFLSFLCVMGPIHGESDNHGVYGTDPRSIGHTLRRDIIVSRIMREIRCLPLSLVCLTGNVTAVKTLN